MKFLIAPDSFKGSLSAREVADAVAMGVRDVLPSAEVVMIPLADGGEGTAATITQLLGGRMEICQTVDPLNRPIEARIGIVDGPNGLCGVIDAASTIGLTLLADCERNPAVTSSRGLGMLMKRAWTLGCRRFIIGLGGTATNDGGRGMLGALGVKFLDKHGALLPNGTYALKHLGSLDLSCADTDILGAEITLLCDVDNPLCGPSGASIVFGPQKGATPQMAIELDEALANYAKIVKAATYLDVADCPGTGAAGGLGYAFLAFTEARLCPGIETVLDLAHFDDQLSGADIVITGEGKLDVQTLHGKAPMGVLRLAHSHCVPCIAIAGQIREGERLSEAGFSALLQVSDPSIPLAESMRPDVAARNIRQTIARYLRQTCI